LQLLPYFNFSFISFRQADTHRSVATDKMFFFSTFVILLVATSSLLRDTMAFPLYGEGALEVSYPFL